MPHSEEALAGAVLSRAPARDRESLRSALSRFADVSSLLRASPTPPDAVLVDLRENSGGALQDMLQLAALFASMTTTSDTTTTTTKEPT